MAKNYTDTLHVFALKIRIAFGGWTEKCTENARISFFFYRNPSSSTFWDQYKTSSQQRNAHTK